MITRGQGDKEKVKHLINGYKVTARKKDYVLEFYDTVVEHNKCCVLQCKLQKN